MQSFTLKTYFVLTLLLGVFLLSGCGHDSEVVPVSTAQTPVISAFSLDGVVGTINETDQSIAVNMAYGTDVTALIATYTTTGDSVDVGIAPQTSAVTANDFTSPVDYRLTAVDGSTATYTVTATLAPGSTSKAITQFSINGNAGVIDETAKTIVVDLPNATVVTALIATYTTTGEFVDVGVVQQASTVTANDFTAPVIYTVTAVDGSTATYTVTASAAATDAKAITQFSIDGNAGNIDEAAKTITMTLPFGTDLTALVSTFSTTGASVKVGVDLQTSAVTANDFTASVDYIVTAADNTTATYTVSVQGPLGPLPVNLGTAGDFVILAKTAVTTTGVTAVTGDIGLSPNAATAYEGFNLIADSTNTFSTSSLVTGNIFAADYTAPTPTKMTTAISDMQLAFEDAAGRITPDFNSLGAGNISGLTLTPGLYKWGTGVMIDNTGVTLTGGANDIWIFQVDQNLTVDNAAIVTLSGGAQAKNIFWQVAGQTTLGTTVQFKGIILSKTLISFNTGAVLNGRALAQTAVTMNATTITAP